MARRSAVVLMTLILSGALSAPVQAGGGGHMCSGSLKVTDERALTVGMEKFCYAPMVTRVERGETVTWVNRDPYPHTLTAPGNWGAGAKEFGHGDRISFRFDDDGVFPYSCLLHPGMTGVVVVGDGVAEGAGLPAIDPVQERPGTGALRLEPGGTQSSSTPWVVLGVSASALLLVATALFVYRRRLGAGRARPVLDA